MRYVRALMIWLFGCSGLLAQPVPDLVMKRLQKDPGAYLDLAADLIHGFGGAQGIDRAGIARFVALQRAAERASAMRRLLLADLDFDGQISKVELGDVAAAASAYARGRLWKLHEAADRDGDGVVVALEVEAFGRAEAMRLFSVADEAEIMSVLAFDGDKNGWVDLPEVRAALAALGI